MEEQMSLKLILDTEIKIWFKISVSKIWNRGRKCSFIFPDMFSREKTLSVLSHGLLPVPNVKSSSLYRTTNTTMLVQQNKKEKKKSKTHHASDGYRVGSRSQPWPTPAAGATRVLNWKRACIGGNNASAGRGGALGLHHTSSSTCVNARAPCFKYQIKLSESVISEEEKKM